MKENGKRRKEFLFEAISKVIGKWKVRKDEATLVAYGFDSSIAPFQKPSLVVLPENRDDVREVLMVANKKKVPVTVMAGGVNIGGMCVPSEGGIVIDFRFRHLFHLMDWRECTSS